MMDIRQQKHLIYQSRYRGMKELDLVFRHFQDYIDDLTPEEKKQYERLLEASEADLYNWLILGTPPSDPHTHLVALIRQALL